MKRSIIVLALAASAALGATGASAMGTTTAETANRNGLTQCVLVDEARKLGLPLSRIPFTVQACTRYRLSISR